MALVMPAAGEPYLMKVIPTDDGGGGHPELSRLKQLQAVVGGYIEAVYLRAEDGERIVMFVNEGRQAPGSPPEPPRDAARARPARHRPRRLDRR